jgi:hypothetical protein
MSDQAFSPPSNATVQLPSIVVPSQLQLHWIVVLLITGVVNKFLGGGIGSTLWLLLQSRWVRTVTGESKAYNLTITSIVLFGATFVTGFFTSFSSASASSNNTSTPAQMLTIVLACLMLLFFIAGLVIYLMAAFALRRELEAAPFSMKLSGPMTFFFGPIYFQYYLQKWGLPGELGGPPVAYAAPPSPPSPPPAQS